jgi:hypothetical protein
LQNVLHRGHLQEQTYSGCTRWAAEIQRTIDSRPSVFPKAGVRIDTIKTVIFLIAENLDFGAINPHAGQPT